MTLLYFKLSMFKYREILRKHTDSCINMAELNNASLCFGFSSKA